MGLEYKLGGNEMGIFKRKQTVGEQDPEGRRRFVKNLGIGAATLFASGTLGLGSAIAGGTPEIAIPSAIVADPDVAVRVAWRAFTLQKGNPQYNMNGTEFALSILKLDSNGHIGTQFKKIDDFTPRTSHAFYLLAARMSRLGSWLIDEYLQENPGLKEYVLGLGGLYGKRNLQARQHFANGIFIAANLGPKEYTRLNKIGVTTQYNERVTMEANAIGLANEFINSDLRKKELMLNIGVGEKFKGVKGNNMNTNVNSEEYQLKNIYWNLGFYISTEFACKNDEIALQMRNNNANQYRKIRNLLAANYNTANGKLL